jgi:hypothetical protein
MHQTTAKQQGYLPSRYDDGMVCNAGGSGACGDPHSTGSLEKWSLVNSQTAKLSIRGGGWASDIDLETGKPVYLALQVGGPSLKIGTGYVFGYVSDSITPMAKFGITLGFMVGADASLSVGFNGIKGSLSFAGGNVGATSGTFPRQTVTFGFGAPSVSVGVGMQ